MMLMPIDVIRDLDAVDPGIESDVLNKCGTGRGMDHSYDGAQRAMFDQLNTPAGPKSTVASHNRNRCSMHPTLWACRETLAVHCHTSRSDRLEFRPFVVEARDAARDRIDHDAKIQFSSVNPLARRSVSGARQSAVVREPAANLSYPKAGTSLARINTSKLCVSGVWLRICVRISAPCRVFYAMASAAVGNCT